MIESGGFSPLSIGEGELTGISAYANRQLLSGNQRASAIHADAADLGARDLHAFGIFDAYGPAKVHLFRRNM